MAPGDLITRDGQVEWGGILLGSGTPYRWLNMTGLEDLPGLDSGNVLRPSRHGAWPGRYLAQERVVTWDLLVNVDLTWEWGPIVTALRQTLALSDEDSDEDEPLVIRTKGGETRLLYARVTSRLMPNEPRNGVGRGNATVQWTAADPRLYSPTEYTVTIGQPTEPSGLTWPLTWPLNWGSGGDSGSRQLTNAGDVESSPVLEITGPCEVPAVTNLRTGRTIELSITLAAGETLVVDTREGTATLGGADRLYLMTARCVPPELWTLQPGTSEISYRAASFGGGSSCVVRYRDAYM